MTKAWKKWVILVFLVVGIATILYFLLRDQLSLVTVDTIAALLQRLGPWAAVIGGGLIILQTFFPAIPFLILAGANVLVFGLWGGFLVNWISAVIGSIFMFFIARTIGREWAQGRINKYPKIKSVNHFLGRNSFKTIFILRLFPVIPPAAVNLAAGIAPISFKYFCLATVFGKIPAIFLESMIGHDLFHFAHNKTRFFVLLFTLIVVVGLGARVLKKKISIS
ncbi:MAG TPA: TVP38/TMEM64 family protein [Bacillota bacterium]|nr:TVP38/TMEM64 family protein [Bacillota bacterium]